MELNLRPISKILGTNRLTSRLADNGKKVVIPKPELKKLPSVKNYFDDQVPKMRNVKSVPGLPKLSARREVKVLRGLGNTEKAYELARRLGGLYKNLGDTEKTVLDTISKYKNSGDKATRFKEKMKEQMFPKMPTANREREVAKMDSNGVESIVSKVMYPGHGMAVRKVHAYPDLRDKSVEMHRLIQLMQDHSGRDLGYGKVVGTDPRGMIFQDYLSPHKWESAFEYEMRERPDYLFGKVLFGKILGKDLLEVRPNEEFEEMFKGLKEMGFKPFDNRLHNTVVLKKNPKIKKLFDIGEETDFDKHWSALSAQRGMPEGLIMKKRIIPRFKLRQEGTMPQDVGYLLPSGEATRKNRQPKKNVVPESQKRTPVSGDMRLFNDLLNMVRGS
jgi:hypothetical protein